jgi:hypothetical protein
MSMTIIGLALALVNVGASDLPADAQTLDQSVFMCKISEENDDLLVLVTDYRSPSKGASYSLEVADPASMIVGPSLVQWLPQGFGEPNGPRFLFKSENWPASGMALGIKPANPRQYHDFGGKKNEFFDAALFDGGKPIKFGHCMVGVGSGAVEYFHNIKNKGPKVK